jgi:UDP-sugar transporter A1/2/3
MTSQLNNEIIQKPKDTFKLAVPSFLYAIQNNLYYVALSNVDAVTYSVTYQFKIFATAICSVLMLGKKLDFFKYVSLLVLVIGIILVQVK